MHLLLKHGADPAVKDQVLSRHDRWLVRQLFFISTFLQYGTTAYQVASSMNHTEMAQMISHEQVGKLYNSVSMCLSVCLAGYLLTCFKISSS